MQGGSLRLSRPMVDPLSCGAAEARAPFSRSSEEVGGAAGVRTPALRWLGPPRLQLPAEASVSGKIVRLGIDAECATGGGAERHPTALAVSTHLGRRSPG
jgi:hypothetical protein